MAFIDFKQAFERVWRDGLLHRLWEAGIRGNMWRVIANQLSHTFAYVRTNYGDTDHFETFMGVIQGSVLGPVLFLIFISPLAEDLDSLSPTLNGLKLRPQLFADDGLLLQVGSPDRATLMRGCLEWATRWLLPVSLPKCILFSLFEPSDRTCINGHVFKEVEGTTHLGVGLDRRGVFSFAKLRKDLIDISNRHTQLLTVGVMLGKLRTDIGLFLFGSRATSLSSHALPVSDPSSHRIDLLDDTQATFAKKFLMLPDSFPSDIAKAELGLQSYRIRATKAQLLLIVRTLQNPSDTLTCQLLTWPLTTDGKTMLDIATDHIHALGIRLSLNALKTRHYSAVKILVSAAANTAQQTEWSGLTREHTARWNSLNLTKPKWGIDSHLLRQPPLLVTTYLQIRSGSFTIPSDPQGSCPNCHSGPPSLPHLLWTCPESREARTALRAALGVHCPHAIDYINDLDSVQATTYALGQGAWKHSLWSAAQPPLLRFIHDSCVKFLQGEA